MILHVVALLFLWLVALGYPAVGNVPQKDQHPWLVSIQSDDNHICQGSILSESVILTAAICTNDPLNSLSVRVGSSSIDGGSKHQVVEFKRHEDYHKEPTQMNLALLRVSPPINFSENVTKVALAEKGDVVKEGTSAEIAGWGLPNEKSGEFPLLKSTRVRVIRKTKKWKDMSGILMTMPPGAIACYGAIGSSLTVDGVQIGTLAWSYGCPNPVIPNIYVDVAVHRDWIDQNHRILNLPKEVSNSEKSISNYFYQAVVQWSSNGVFVPYSL